MALGGCDTEIQNIAAEMPAGSYPTYHHEPENDMTGVQFVAAFEHAYTVAKAANPNITVVPIYMSYQWRSGSTHVTNNGTGGDNEIQDWIVPPGYADAYGLDLYWQASTRGSEPDDPVSVGSDPRMIRWYNAFAGQGRPLTLPERGIDDDQGTRASRGPAIPRVVVDGRGRSGTRGGSIRAACASTSAGAALRHPPPRRDLRSFRRFAATSRRPRAGCRRRPVRRGGGRPG